ncbi:Nramp family divalent metal transporter [Bradyrhizobium sp. STM 3557]|uniref:Nramp family divalent metal transporter n=1 Tax=Bradyrhizobium sp. STM 3557 TaxID=578920 RepID=UPI00388D7F11
MVTGAADDDCSAIGTYASAGAKFGLTLLWTAPVTFPMMFAIVYLSSKLGQVAGKGLFQLVKDHYPRWVLWPALVGVLIGNTIEAGADLAGMAAAVNIFLPVSPFLTVVGVAILIFLLQTFGSYTLIRNVFRWLALALFAYAGAAVLARPDLNEVLRGTFIPHIELSKEALSILVAIIGTTLSAYLYTWQSNIEVEEKIAQGKTRIEQRQGASSSELQQSSRDIVIGMAFSNFIMYTIILATGATLFKAGNHDIESAAQAAQALRPLLGPAAEALFAIGIIGVGFLAVPVMTAGASYDLCQAVGWKASLNARPAEAKHFYIMIGAFTLAAIALNAFRINPMKALVYAGIVQGFSTPPLLLMIVLMTNDRKIMGDKTNSFWLNLLSWITVVAIFAASAGLVVSWLV